MPRLERHGDIDTGWRRRRSRGASARCRAGASARRPTASSPRWPRSACARRSSARSATCRSSRRRSARRSTATACGWSAASCRSCCTSRDARARARRPSAMRAPSWPGAGAEVFNAAVVADDDVVSPASRSTTTPGGASRATSREIERAGRGARAHARAAPARRHAGRDGRGRRARCSRATDVRLVPGYRAPADRRRRPRRLRRARHGERVVHVHLKDVDMGVAARLRAGELSLVEATQAGLFRPARRGRRADRRGPGSG